MSNGLNRRSFLKTGALLGAGSLMGVNAFSDLFSKSSGFFAMDKTDLSVVKGENYYNSTIKAVDMLGGISKFVKSDSKVGLLINSRYNKPGTYVKPEIALAVLNMCLDAGVKEITSLENVSGDYWNLSAVSKQHTKKIAAIKQAGNNYTKVKIPNGISLKEAEVEKAFLDCDVLINIAIFKQHAGIKKTCVLKNYMGLTSSGTNKFFHFGSNAKDWYADVNFLSHCIADVNLLKKPTLCVCDATEFITTNGPFGPGNVVKQQKVIAGTDRVAIDAYGASVLGYKASEILPIKMAYDYKMGEIDLSKLKIKEVKI
jgi:uncharacterized protein (DUF362 family)